MGFFRALERGKIFSENNEVIESKTIPLRSQPTDFGDHAPEDIHQTEDMQGHLLDRRRRRVYSKQVHCG